MWSDVILQCEHIGSWILGEETEIVYLAKSSVESHLLHDKYEYWWFIQTIAYLDDAILFCFVWTQTKENGGGTRLAILTINL